MDNQELLAQVTGLIKEQSQVFSEQLSSVNVRFDGIDQRFTKIEQRFDGIDQRFTKNEQRFDEFTREITDAMSQMTEAHTMRIELKMESEITNRIDALFDGYKLTHEKQWELEHKTAVMQSQIEDLQLRLASLESKTA